MATPSRAALLAEAYRRDILPAPMKAAYEEASRRGLVGPISAPAAPAEDPGFFSELSGSFTSTLSRQNPRLYGSGVEALGIAAGSETLEGVGEAISSLGGDGPPDYQPAVPSFTDIDSVGDVLPWAGGALGQGAASMVLPAAGGAVGALAGSLAGPVGTVAGGYTGATLAGAPLNTGEIFETLKEEGVAEDTAANWAAAVTPVVAGLDIVSLGALTKPFTRGIQREVNRSIARRIAQGIASGAITEGSTEGLQQIVQETVAAHLTDNPDVARRAGNVVDAAAAGALPGAAIRGAGGVLPDRVPQRPPEEERAPADSAEAVAATPADAAPVAPADPDADPSIDPDPQFAAALPGEVEIDADEGEGTTAEKAFLNPETGAIRFPGQRPVGVQTAPAAPGAAQTMEFAAPNSRTTITTDGPITVDEEIVGQPVAPDAAAQPVAPAASEPGENIDTAPAGQASGPRFSGVPVEADTPIEVGGRIDDAAYQAAAPTPAQAEAGNYRKGHVRLDGLDITIETPRGATRSGAGPDGQPWSVRMPAHYGYIKRSEGADGEHVDVYLGPMAESTGPVFIVDQVDPATGAFDEHKALIGFPSREAAVAVYDAAFSDGSGSARRSAVTAMEPDQFKGWLSDGATDPASSFRRDTAAPVTPEWTARRAELTDKLRRLAAYRFGDELRVDILDRMTDPEGNEVWGAFLPSRTPGGAVEYLAAVSLSQGNPDPVATLNHEGIHFLRRIGAITGTEWRALRRRAEKPIGGKPSWIERFGIEDRYSRPEGMSEGRYRDMIAEEAVAEAYAAYAGGERFIGHADTIFEKIRSFLERFAGFVRGAGFSTAEDIFGAIDRGERAVSRRGGQRPDRGLTGGAPDFQRPTALGHGIAIPDIATVDFLADANLGLMDRLRGGVPWSKLRTHADLLRTKLQDRFLPVLRAQQAIERARGKPLDEAENVYLAEELYSGRAGEKLFLFGRDYKEPLLATIHESGIPVADVEAYLYAKHAKERNAHISAINPRFRPGEGSGMTDAEADAILSRAATSGQVDKLEHIAAQVRRILDYNLNQRVEAQLMTREQARTWRQTYPNYVPLRGFEEMDGAAEAARPAQGRGYQVHGPESRQAMGRQSRAGDILANSLMMAEEGIIRGEKNRVGLALLDMVRKTPGFGEINKLTVRPVFNKATGLVEYRRQAAMDREALGRSVEMKEKGQRVVLTLADRVHGPKIAAAMTNLNQSALPAILQYSAGLNRYLSSVNTMLNPAFTIVNFIRDVITASINIRQYDGQDGRPDLRGIDREMLRDLRKALQGTWGGVRGREDTEWQKYFREYAEAGSRVSFFRMDDLKAQREKVRQELRDLDPRGHEHFTKAFRGVFNYIDMANNSVDNAVRLSAYVNARRRGLSKPQAASLAKNLTVNFNRRGEWGPQINALYLFYNASMQGSAVLIQAAVRSKKVRQAIYGQIIAGFALEMLNAFLLSGDDDDGQSKYDKMSDFEKSRNLIVMNPFGGIDFKIPLPYGYNVFFEMGRNVAALTRGHQGLGKTVSSVLGTAVDAFNPIGGIQSWGNFLAPTALDPVVDLDRNENFFGSPIMPEQRQYGVPEPDSERHFSSVNPALREAAQMLNTWTGGNAYRSGMVDVSPETMEYWLDFAGGAAGAFFKRALVDLPAKFLAGEELTMNDVPFARRVLEGETPTWLDVSNAYDRIADVEALENEVTGLRDGGQRRESIEVRRANPQVTLFERAKDVREDLRRLRSDEQRVNANPNIRGQIRRIRLEQIKAERKRVVDGWNREYLARVGN